MTVARLKIFAWQGDGFTHYMRRLERGRFRRRVSLPPPESFVRTEEIKGLRTH